MTPVKQLIVVSSYLDSPLRIPLKEDGKLDTLASFDTNHDGIIKISVDSAKPSSKIEVSFANNSHFQYNSADALARRLHSLNPLSQAQKNEIFDKTLVPSLKNPGDKSWEAAKRVLILLGDAENLSTLGNLALEEGDPESAEDTIYNALQISADKEDYWNEQGGMKETLFAAASQLDEKERKQFLNLIENPYLLAGSVSTMTSIVGPNENSSYVAFVVGVTPEWEDEQDDPKAAILDFFEKEQRITAQPSKLNDQLSNLNLPLLPVEAIQWTDDRRKELSPLYSTPSINEADVNNNVFRGERSYYQVVFEIPKANEALREYPSRKMNLVFENTEGIVREEKGVFILTKEDDLTPYIDASDLHVAMDDWENIKDIIEGFKNDEKKGIPLDPLKIKEVERFYASSNERTMALLTLADEKYRRKEISKVQVLGDMYDYANILMTLESQSYHFTNARFFSWMLENCEVPIEGVPGNHDRHGIRWRPGDHPAYYPLIGEEDSLPYMEEIADKHFPKNQNAVESLMQSLNALNVWSTDDVWDFPMELGKRVLFEVMDDLGNLVGIKKQVPYQPLDDTLSERDDLIMGNTLQHLTPYQNFTSPGPKNIRFFYMDTGAESHDARFLYESFLKPLGAKLSLPFWKLITNDFNPESVQQFIDTSRKAAQDLARNSRLNGAGPSAETLLEFSNGLAQTREEGRFAVLETHFPIYNHVTNKKHYDADDVIHNPNNHALQIIQQYYVYEDGTPVMLAMISGHVHIRSSAETGFKLNEEERASFQYDVGKVLAKQNTKTLLEDLDAIWNKYDLDNNLDVERKWDIDNYKVDAHDKRITYLTLDAAGRNDDGDETGFAIMNFKPDGSLIMDYQSFYVTPEKEIVVKDDLKDYRSTRLAELEDWNKEKEFYAAKEPQEEDSWLSLLYNQSDVMVNMRYNILPYGGLKYYKEPAQMCSVKDLYTSDKTISL